MKKRITVSEPNASDSFWGGIVKAMGLVFGDIGTSPIYTLAIVFALTKPSPDNILGIVSLIVWTLTILVTIEYAWLATSLSHRGEGGAIVLREILLPLLKSGRAAALVTVLTLIGVSLLLGDGVITPAISILSAVEGIMIIPGMEQTSGKILLAIAMVITVILFLFQSRGTDKIAWTFGPIMLIWFIALTVSGFISLMSMPGIIKAVNPYYAFKFVYDNGISGFFVLSEVILCATGGEALYNGVA
jgi:KUP system potassium uptake protein